MKRFRFTLRDLFWLLLVASCLINWQLDRWSLVEQKEQAVQRCEKTVAEAEQIVAETKQLLNRIEAGESQGSTR